MTKKSRFVRIAVPALASLVLIVVTSFLFILHMNRMIEYNTMNTINELAEHDMSAIIQFVENNWHNLENLRKRLEIYGCDTVLKTQERLDMERAASNFHSLFLIDDDNIIYSDRGTILKNEELKMLANLDWRGRNKLVRRFDYSVNGEIRREMLLYAIKVDNYKIDGKNIRAIVGISDLNAIQDNLIIYYFNRGNDTFRGYSSVVNYYGDYIVNIYGASDGNKRDNLFELLEIGTVSGGYTKETIAAKMISDETFRFTYIDSSGVEKFMYFMPINETPWYFVSMVEKKVFTEQTRSFVSISLSMLLVALVIFLSMLILVGKSSREAMLARAETKARSEFLSNMSHEIRTPLNGIIGLLYLMRTNLENGNTSQIESLLDKAQDSSQYLLSLVSDILDMSKLHAEKLDLFPKPFNLYELLGSVAEMQQSNVDARGLVMEIDAIIPSPYVIGDETRIKQVLMNIVGNSAKFTPQGGRITITVQQERASGDFIDTRIICSDTGVGMSEEFQKTIWNSFTQEHNRLSGGIRGTGLGMAITKGIIDAMGGTISVSSKLDEGTTFTINIRFPVAQRPESKKEIEAKKAKLEESENQGIDQTKRMKIILAEDIELNAEILTQILELNNFSVVVAENGKIAYDVFVNSTQGEFQAILMDMQMPVMDGCEAARKIRDSNHPDAKTVQIFACTANVFQDDKDKAFASGMDDFLIKPIDVDVLFEKLKKT